MQRTILLLHSLLVAVGLAASIPDGIQYIHPRPNSNSISPQSTILLKVRNAAQPSIPHFSVCGEISGLHSGKCIRSGETFIFTLEKDFTEFEHVNVQVTHTKWPDTLSWTFSTGEYPLKNAETNEIFHSPSIPIQTSGDGIKKINGVAVPFDFPTFTPEINYTDSASGKIFISTCTGPYYFMILENDGTPYFYQHTDEYEHTHDFKVHPNGLLSRYYQNFEIRHYIGMDSSFQTIKTFSAANGYQTDQHDFLWLENGHYIMIVNGFRRVQMDTLINGYHDRVVLIDCHIQEFVADDNLVYEWLCFDHMDINNVDDHELDQSMIDWLHINSVAVDYDDNLILSIRHFSQVIKIDRQTGDVMWRLGGKDSDFIFTNNDPGLSYQHNAQPVPGKPNHYTVFDNGNYHNPRFSRGVEYVLDMNDMTASVVWEYRSPDGTTNALGNVQTLANGDKLINWGEGELPKITQLSPNGEVVYEGNFIDDLYSYRVFRFDWQSQVKKPHLYLELLGDRIGLIFNKFGDKSVAAYEIYGGLDSENPEYLATTDKTWFIIENPENRQHYYFQVRAVHKDGSKSQFSDVRDINVRITPQGVNILKNGDFSSGVSQWKLGTKNGAQASMQVTENGELVVKITNGGLQLDDIQIIQKHIPLIRDLNYHFEIAARTDRDKPVEAKFFGAPTTYKDYSDIPIIKLSRRNLLQSFNFSMAENSNSDASFVLNCGGDTTSVYLQHISLIQLPTVVRHSDETPKSFSIISTYPNPFNPTTTIHYELPEPVHVTVDVFNIRGRKIERLVDRFQSAGEYKIEFDANNLPSGPYVCRMQAGEFKSTRKLLLLR